MIIILLTSYFTRRVKENKFQEPQTNAINNETKSSTKHAQEVIFIKSVFFFCC